MSVNQTLFVSSQWPGDDTRVVRLVITSASTYPAALYYEINNKAVCGSTRFLLTLPDQVSRLTDQNLDSEKNIPCARTQAR